MELPENGDTLKLRGLIVLGFAYFCRIYCTLILRFHTRVLSPHCVHWALFFRLDFAALSLKFFPGRA